VSWNPHSPIRNNLELDSNVTKTSKGFMRNLIKKCNHRCRRNSVDFLISADWCDCASMHNFLNEHEASVEFLWPRTWDFENSDTWKLNVSRLSEKCGKVWHFWRKRCKFHTLRSLNDTTGLFVSWMIFSNYFVQTRQIPSLCVDDIPQTAFSFFDRISWRTRCHKILPCFESLRVITGR
jgi:hypothetical protein